LISEHTTPFEFLLVKKGELMMMELMANDELICQFGDTFI